MSGVRPSVVSIPAVSIPAAGGDAEDDKVAAMASMDRAKALEAALGQIDRQFGKGSVMRLGEGQRVAVEIIPSGSIALDVALGIGGLPRGRVVEIYGPESSGKTTLALHAVANVQKAGGVAAFIDAEHALDPEYARKLGVDVEQLLISQPDTGEQALEIADILIRSGGIDVLVIDSVAALVPKAEIEGEMGDSHVGLQARLMSQALRKITGGLSNSGTTAIFINQLREKIGVFFGSPETTTGGKALKFYASIRLDIRRIETLKEGTDAVGNRTRVKVVKNKMAPPFKQAEFDILYGHGISREGEIIDLGVEHGFIRKSGAWYTCEGDQLGQGKENARAFLIDNPQLSDELEIKIKQKLGVGPGAAVAGEESQVPLVSAEDAASAEDAVAAEDEVAIEAIGVDATEEVDEASRMFAAADGDVAGSVVNSPVIESSVIGSSVIESSVQ
jgi:recombination protein RecA